MKKSFRWFGRMGLLVNLLWCGLPACAQPQTGYATFFTRESCRREGTSGLLMASGRPYNEQALVCALPKIPDRDHRSRPQWGQKYRITNLRTGRSIQVAHWDYGPGKAARSRGVIMDLSPAAFKAIGGRPADGRVKIKMEFLATKTRRHEGKETNRSSVDATAGRVSIPKKGK